MVSARHISSAGSSSNRSTMPSTRAAGTGPSNGQPNDTEMVTVKGLLSARARRTRASAVATPSSVVAFWLRLPKVSVAARA
jgi:hypothetical protein